MKSVAAPPPQEAVAPLIRGLALLREICRADGHRSVGALVRTTGLARATVDRMISTLAHAGYLRVAGREVFITPRLMELSNAYLAACRLPDLLGPIADGLADELDESVSIAVADHDGIRFVHQVLRRRAMSLTFRLGDLLPAERGAPGALFAADWDDETWQHRRDRLAAPHEADSPYSPGFPAVPVGPGDGAASFEERVRTARAQGWSLDDQLIEPGLIAIAVPVRGPGDGERTICAVSVVSHTSRHSVDSLRAAVLPRLRLAVTSMTRALADADDSLGGTRPPGAGWARDSKQELGPDFVSSLARGLSVLSALGEARPWMTLSAVAEVTGLARATARRALITLEYLGYVRSEGRLFRLTPHVLELGCSQLSRLTLPQIAEPHLAALVDRVHDSASMAVLSGDEIQYVARVPTVRIMSVNITVGTRFPAHATAMGRVLLAGRPAVERATRLREARLTALTRHTVTDPDRLSRILDQVAEDGYALVSDELEEGLRSLAVPVRDATGRVVGAINISMHAHRLTAERSRAELLPPLRDTAARIEADLRALGRYSPVATS